jgi:hypothetical protein
LLTLCHDTCTETGSVFEVGGGFVAKLRWQRTEVHVNLFRESSSILTNMTTEDVSKKFDDICNFDKECDYPASGNDTFARIMEFREKAKL